MQPATNKPAPAEEIIMLLQRQDKKAMELIYDAYAPTLYGIILKIVPQQDQAEDILQESLIKIWENGTRFDGQKGALFTWMLNIARNTAIDKRRSKAYKLNNYVETSAPELSNSLAYSEQCNTDLIGVKEQVVRLEEKYQKIIELIYFQGFTQKEVTQHLNIPLGTVKSRLRIGLRELRKVFGQKDTSYFLWTGSLFRILGKWVGLHE